ncbi:HAD hydrolase-like protein [Microbacterium sp. zg.Y909]|uniref:HAD hydrolase-like protein n=1 Tax=Microbacterium sp. zg.Y909 TaxID=2969413 RepID=UPI00214AE60B|nr:HAD hydrolase-like protein [Microbacterium sp. zg.Y909]MCR2825073.1 HAD hydrolase-like protein [Microbacterium sp. zg.Y909]
MNLIARLVNGQEIDVAGFLFDMDGTLLDSIASIEDAWAAWAAEWGVDPSPPLPHGVTAASLIAHLGVPAERRAAAQRSLAQIEARPGQRIALKQGAGDLLEAVPRERWGIVTSAARSVAHARLTAAGIRPPHVLVTGDDVDAGKPAPDPFSLGMARLSPPGTPEGPIVAVEDTVVGAESARAAGCLVVAVEGTATDRELTATAHVVVASLACLVARVRGGGLRVSIERPPAGGSRVAGALPER